MSDTAKSTVLIDTAQAEQALEQLQAEAVQLKNRMLELKRSNDLAGFEELRRDVQANTKAQAALKKELYDVNAVMKNLSGASMKQLRQAHNAISNELNRMTRGTKEYVAASKNLKLVKAEIDKVNASMRTSAASQQSMGSKLMGALGKIGPWAMGAAAAVTGLSMGIRQLSKEADEFESTLANLSAITGLRGEDMNWLGERAKVLSTTTTKEGVRITQSANDIVEAFTIMGSKKSELLQSKEALASVTTEALKLASAAKMDTKVAVESLANVMNQFGADSSQAARYVNVLAAGSAQGAADVDKIAASIIKFGPAAASANVSVEESVALVETLAEKGLEGEIAGTKLRNILIRLQTGADEFNPKVVGLNKALENLKKANLSTGDAAKKFGVQSYDAYKILVDNRDMVEKLTKSVTNTNTATQQAIINTNTHKASLQQRKNEFKLTAIEMGQRLAPAVSGVTSATTLLMKGIIGVTSAFTKWRVGVPQSFSDAAVKIREEQREVMVLTGRLTDANTKEDERRRILHQLKKINKEVVEGLNAENISMEQLRKNLEAYNKAAVNKIILSNLQKEEEKELTKEANLTAKKVNAEFEILQKIGDLKPDVLATGQNIAAKVRRTLEAMRRDELKLQYQWEQELKKSREAQARGENVDKSAGNPVAQAYYSYITKGREYDKVNRFFTSKLNEIEKIDKKIEKQSGKTVELQKRIAAMKALLGIKDEEVVVDGGKSEDKGEPVITEAIEKKTALARALEEIDRQHNKIVMDMHKQRITGELAEEEMFNGAMLAEDMSHNFVKQQTIQKFLDDERLMSSLLEGKKFKDEEERSRALLELREKLSDDLIALKTKEYEMALKLEDDFNKKIAENRAKADEEERKRKEQQDAEDRKREDDKRAREQAELERTKQYSQQIGQQLGEALGALMSNQEDAQAEFSKAMVMIMFDALNAMIPTAVAAIFAQETSKHGKWGLVTAAATTVALYAAVGALKAVAMSQMNKIGQRYDGKYDVIGAQDGKPYSVGYAGVARTGIYGQPVLVAERGDELIVDHRTLSNLRLNFPDVLPTIRAAMVPQHYAGNVAQLEQSATSSNSELRAVLEAQAIAINRLNARLEQGIRADISYSRTREQLAKGDNARDRGKK